MPTLTNTNITYKYAPHLLASLHISSQQLLVWGLQHRVLSLWLWNQRLVTVDRLWTILQLELQFGGFCIGIWSWNCLNIYKEWRQWRHSCDIELGYVSVFFWVCLYVWFMDAYKRQWHAKSQPRYPKACRIWGSRLRCTVAWTARFFLLGKKLDSGKFVQIYLLGFLVMSKGFLFKLFTSSCLPKEDNRNQNRAP